MGAEPYFAQRTFLLVFPLIQLLLLLNHVERRGPLRRQSFTVSTRYMLILQDFVSVPQLQLHVLQLLIKFLICQFDLWRQLLHTQPVLMNWTSRNWTPSCHCRMRSRRRLLQEGLFFNLFRDGIEWFPVLHGIFLLEEVAKGSFPFMFEWTLILLSMAVVVVLLLFHLFLDVYFASIGFERNLERYLLEGRLLSWVFETL